MTIATAGHIDHGKSALVAALTGTHPDRLPEERRRGMTLDLGFAHSGHGGAGLSFVDVPGHERFVRTMLAGAAGVDAVLLVIACDAGVQPQTREHAAICGLLGIRGGVIALTKCDLADAARIAQVRAQAAALAAGTFLETCEVLAVSAKTGEGIAALRAALIAAVGAAPARDPAAPLRLPLDRAFTVAGFGTVVTGTLIAGTLRPGDEVELAPAGRLLRVRGVQVHSLTVEAARAGQRVAANLAGIEVAALHRGMELLEPGVFAPTRTLAAAMTLLPGAAPAHRARLRLHLHTGQTLATLYWLEPGRFAQLRLEQPGMPVVAAPGDRFILRQLSPLLTLAGGEVLDPQPPRLRRSGYASASAHLAALAAAPDLGARLLILLQRAGAEGCELAVLARACGCRVSAVEAALAPAAQAVLGGRPPAAIDAAALEGLERALLATLAAFHARQPSAPGAALDELVLPGAARWHALAAERLAAAGALCPAPGGRFRLAAHTPVEDGALRADMETRFRELGWSPPPLPVFLAAFPQPAARATAAALARAGILVECQPGWFLHSAALERLRALLAEHKAIQPSFSVADFKLWTGLSRKFAIPLLEYCDRARLTARQGDQRRIR